MNLDSNPKHTCTCVSGLEVSLGNPVLALLFLNKVDSSCAYAKPHQQKQNDHIWVKHDY
jgi:hypothetical protein